MQTTISSLDNPQKTIVITKNGHARIKQSTEPPEERWARCVKSARILVMGRNMIRKTICELCLEACDIQRGGGGHWSNFDTQHHIGKFAEEIGMHPKTLGNWMLVYRFVFEKLPEKERDDFNWSVGEKVRKQIKNIKSNSKQIEQTYSKIKNQTPEEKTHEKILKYIANLKSNFKNLNVKQRSMVRSELENLLTEL